MYRKIGLIGCGNIARVSHIPAYIVAESGYIHGFYSRTRASAEKLRLLYVKKMKRRLKKATSEDERELCSLAMQCEVYDDWQKLLIDVDAVDICTPPSSHMEYAKAAADLGKAIMVEKPVARTYPEVVRVMDSIQNVPFYVFSQLTYNPIFQFGKQIIDSGKIGDLKEIISLRSNPIMTWATANENF
ncbi:MAG: Gfo/Idh/MocA family protein [Promethearchaeota archaeon]